MYTYLRFVCWLKIITNYTSRNFFKNIFIHFCNYELIFTNNCLLPGHPGHQGGLPRRRRHVHLRRQKLRRFCVSVGRAERPTSAFRARPREARPTQHVSRVVAGRHRRRNSADLCAKAADQDRGRGWSDWTWMQVTYLWNGIF